jgi:hypothetical protein
MEVNSLLSNARFSIRVNREFDSIVTDTSDLQFIKQRGPITSTNDGMRMTVNPLQPTDHGDRLRGGGRSAGKGSAGKAANFFR